MAVSFVKFIARDKEERVLAVSQATSSRSSGNIILYDQTGGDEQWIHIQENQDDTCSLFFRHSGLCLAVPEGKNDLGLLLCQYDFRQLDDQKWEMEPVYYDEEKERQYITLRNRKTGLYVAAKYDGFDNGTPFYQWSIGQHFYLSKEFNAEFTCK